MGNKKILITVPAFNEAKNIEKTIEDIRQSSVKCDILVVDDGSLDNTMRVAMGLGVKVIRLPFNLGIGGAVQTGFKFAYENGYDVMVQIDGDYQHDASFLSILVEPVLAGTVDMVIGSRFLEGKKGYQSSFARRIGINFFVGLIGMLTQCKITDPTSGFRACGRKLIRIFARYYPQDFPEPEAIAVARRYHSKIEEAAVTMRQRNAGQSSIRELKTFYYMVKVTFAIFLDQFKRTDKELI